jgi:hypothetical protein
MIAPPKQVMQPSEKTGRHHRRAPGAFWPETFDRGSHWQVTHDRGLGPDANPDAQRDHQDTGRDTDRPAPVGKQNLRALARITDQRTGRGEENAEPGNKGQRHQEQPPPCINRNAAGVPADLTRAQSGQRGEIDHDQLDEAGGQHGR